MKAVTPVIAVIMLLLITLAVTAIAYTTLLNTQEKVSQETKNATEEQTQALGENFRVVNVENNKVLIRNTGREKIETLTFFVDKTPATAVTDQCPDGIESQQVCEYTLVIGSEGEHEIMVLGRIKSETNTYDIADLGPTLSTVDSDGDTGQFNSMIVQQNGLPLIAYYRTSPGVMFARCNDFECLNSDIVQIDSVFSSFYSMDIGSDGLPVIAYRSPGLKIAKCAMNDCMSPSDWTTTDVASPLSYSGATSLKIGADGMPVIGYFNFQLAADNRKPNFAKCVANDCTSPSDWVIVTDIEGPGNTGWFTSLAIIEGRPMMSYFDFTNTYLKIAKCTANDCTSASDWTVTPVSSETVSSSLSDTYIMEGDDGKPLVAYTNFDGKLKMAKCVSGGCTIQADWNTVEIDDGKNKVTATIATDSMPVIAYYNDDDLLELRVAKCTANDCMSPSDWAVTVVDTGGGDYNSIATGADGMPVIAYHLIGANDLKFAKCNRPGC